MANNKSYKELMELMGKTPADNAGKANAMLELIEGREPFSYDPSMDPAAQAVRQETARNIARTTRDTMGSYAAMTGGVPSSAAVAAAAQAGNYAGSQGTDRIMELEQLARQNYNQETNDMRNMWSIFQNQADAERQQELEMAKLAAAYGDYSGLKGLGIDTSKVGNNYIRNPGNPADPVIEEEESGEPKLDPATHNDLLSRYPDGVLPPEVFDQYDAAALTAAGFTRGQNQQPSGGTGRGSRDMGLPLHTRG